MAASEASQLPFVSVVIPSYNGKRYLKGCLESILNVDYPNFEVIIIDDASTDGSSEMIDGLFASDSRLKVIRNSNRLGPSQGRNIGIGMAEGKYVLFLDNDVKVDPDCVNELVKALESDKSIGVAQSKVLFMKHPEKINSAGGFIDPYGNGSLRGEGQTDTGQFDKIDEIFFSSGCAMIASRKALYEVGLFDPRFVFWYEEVDVCWRSWLRGYRVVYVPESRVYHLGGGSRSTRRVFSHMYYLSRNRLLMLIKNYSGRNLSKYGLLVLVTDIAGSIIHSQALGFLTLARAITYILANFRRIWEQRIKVQSLIRKVDENQIRCHMINCDRLRIQDYSWLIKPIE